MGVSSGKKVLIIRLSSMGDVLLTTPLLRQLRQTHPSWHIDFVIKKQFFDCLSENPHINRIHTFDPSHDKLFDLHEALLKEKYDVIVDLQGNFRSVYLRSRLQAKHLYKFRKHKIKRFLLTKAGINLYKNPRPVYLRYFDSIPWQEIAYDGKGLDFFMSQEIHKNIRNMLSSQGFDFGQTTICIAPGAGFQTKRWPVERFAKIARQLQSKGNFQVLLVGGPADVASSAAIQAECSPPPFDVTGQLTIMETAAAISFCSLVVTNDSGLMHLANALKKQTIAIFGPTTYELGFYPLPELSTVIENKQVTCRPCTHIGRHTCPRKHFDCMRSITTERVYQLLIDKLKELSERPHF